MECEVNREEADLLESSLEGEDADEKIEENNQKSNQRKNVRHPSDVYIAQGVYSDFDSILTKFLSLKTSTFEDFVMLWKERKFSHLFDGRESYAELLEFTEEVMTIAKLFILPPHSQIKRIGALYLMYGLYAEQPTRGDVKFRITPQEWSVILKFVENLKAHGFIDANYIFHKMSLEGAFLIVAFSREYGLERNFRKYLMPWPSRDQELDPSSVFSVETLMSRVYRGSLKAAADKCRIKYNKIKQILRGAAGSHFQSLEGTERTLEQIVQENIDNTVDSSVNNPSMRKISSIGSQRKDLKEKAFLLHAPQKNISAMNDVNELQNKNLNVPSDADVMNMSGDSDSSDSDFAYMMKPPSKRNSRRIREQKHKKREMHRKSKEKSEDKSMDKSESEPHELCNKRKVSFREITGLGINRYGKTTRKVNSDSQSSTENDSDKTRSESPEIRADQLSSACSSSQSPIRVSTQRTRNRPSRYSDPICTTNSKKQGRNPTKTKTFGKLKTNAKLSGKHDTFSSDNNT